MDPILKEHNEPLKKSVIQWFKTFLKHPRVDFLSNLSEFLRYLIESMELTSKEPTDKLKNCIDEIRSKFEKSENIKDRKFCIKLLHRLTDILRSDKKNCNWILEKKNPENDLEPPNRLTQIKQVEAFKWIYDILKVQLQNLDLNNI